MKFKSHPPTDLQLAKEHCAFFKVTCEKCYAGVPRPDLALEKGCNYFIRVIAPLRETEEYRGRYGEKKGVETSKKSNACLANGGRKKARGDGKAKRRKKEKCNSK